MDFVQDIVNNDGEVYLVGGINRDRLLDRPNYDVDLMIRLLDIDELKVILRRYGRVMEVGINFGVIVFKTGEHEFDVALPRREVSTGPGYRDFEITSDKDIPVIVDLERRDATINAIAQRVFTLDDILNPTINLDLVIDPFDGISDVNERLWRAVGDPFKRFVEDPTRIMRALRQSAQLNFKLERHTENAIIKHSDLMSSMMGNSSVRLTEELVKLLMADFPVKWIDFIVNRSTIGKLLELNPCDDVSSIMERAVNQDLLVEERVLVLLLQTIDSYESLNNWTKKFSLSAAPHFPSGMVRFILLSKKNYGLISDIDNDVKMRWFIVMMEEKTFSEKLLKVYGVIMNQSMGKLMDMYKQNRDTIMSTNDLLVTGTDIMNVFGILGKQIGDLKNLLFEKVINGELTNSYDDLIKYAETQLKS